MFDGNNPNFTTELMNGNLPSEKNSFRTHHTMKEQMTMPGEAFFFSDPHILISETPRQFHAVAEGREVLPVTGGGDEIVYFFLGIGVLILLLLFVGVVLIYRLGHRWPLNNLIQQRPGAEKIETPSVQQTPEETPDPEALLYKRLCELMEEDELFKNAQLNRDLLAERLGTNHVYLAKAVRRYADGMTIGEFINEVRLSHSAHLLASRPELSIDEVKSMSGFNSRTTFGRLFRERYGSSPTKYRIKSKEKMG